MQLSAVGALNMSLDSRMSASAVGIIAARVATASARYRDERRINERDRRALQVYIAKLRNEARILRGEVSPSVDDESSYAFAGVTLAALEVIADRTLRESDAANELDSLVDKLRMIEGQQDISDQDLIKVESFFWSASEIASQEGEPGRLADPGDNSDPS